MPFGTQTLTLSDLRLWVSVPVQFRLPVEIEVEYESMFVHVSWLVCESDCWVLLWVNEPKSIKHITKHGAASAAGCLNTCFTLATLALCPVVRCVCVFVCYFTITLGVPQQRWQEADKEQRNAMLVGRPVVDWGPLCTELSWSCLVHIPQVLVKAVFSKIKPKMVLCVFHSVFISL